MPGNYNYYTLVNSNFRFAYFLHFVDREIFNINDGRLQIISSDCYLDNCTLVREYILSLITNELKSYNKPDSLIRKIIDKSKEFLWAFLSLTIRCADDNGIRYGDACADVCHNSRNNIGLMGDTKFSYPSRIHYWARYVLGNDFLASNRSTQKRDHWSDIVDFYILKPNLRIINHHENDLSILLFCYVRFVTFLLLSY